MGLISIVGYRPKPGREAEAMEQVHARVPLLRSLNLVTERAPILARSRDGVLIQISEWASEEAIEQAHHIPDVLAMWERFEACCEFVTLSSLAEVAEPFATFAAIDR